jgi:CBS-domain-containing membrane protein
MSVHQMAHQLAESDAKRVLISDGDGRLIGLLRREDVEAALAEKTETARILPKAPGTEVN